MTSLTNVVAEKNAKTKSGYATTDGRLHQDENWQNLTSPSGNDLLRGVTAKRKGRKVRRKRDNVGGKRVAEQEEKAIAKG